MPMRFEGVVSSPSQLRELMGEPVHPIVVDKSLAALDRHCRAFIGRSPFVLIATCDRAGRMDISPKGDPAGFVRVLDDHTLAIPDRPGNQRFDSLRNLYQLSGKLDPPLYDAVRGEVSLHCTTPIAVTGALGRLHALLDKDQRERLAYLIRTGVLTV